MLRKAVMRCNVQYVQATHALFLVHRFRWFFWHPRKSPPNSGTLYHCVYSRLRAQAGTAQLFELDKWWRRRLDVVQCNLQHVSSSTSGAWRLWISVVGP